MSRFNFLKAFKKQNATDERLQLVGFKGGTYSFFVTIFISFAVAFLFILRLEGNIDISYEAFALLLLLPFFAGGLFFLGYLLKNGVFTAQREKINRKLQAQRLKWFILIGQFLWILIFIPLFMQFVFKEPWQEKIGVAIFTALFSTFFTWFFQYRNINNIEE
ncbi:MAG: hypothetical protein V4642_04015 [Bacteroidota bacterium]